MTLFLAGAVLASLFFAPRLNRINGRLAAPIGFGVSALGGFAAGTGLSFTHGTIGRSANPHRLSGLVGMGCLALVQATLALLITLSAGFGPCATGVAMFVAVMLFTHTFAFGQLARLDVSGRAVAATPAMVMIGSAIGPILGGTLVKGVGYSGLGLAAAGRQHALRQRPG